MCQLDTRSVLPFFPDCVEPGVLAVLQEPAARQVELLLQNETEGAFNALAPNTVFCYSHQD